ncbi:PCNA-associated factor [Biomphalaria glabrata]|uniref:PCNA-associated factor n=1 Tax=Biomphalaria glabrata TaxID=6526 RepID=A0A2C9KQY9_BIOGL|nr:PCNA-associated factor-like [Biomphalaria glabrata]XP_055864826.1 PCNA-associated factor-like [Biomphalaria glabrata]XP_055864827.1 PCNA-associated factor-like [Biomphalaria glabrata]XP_055864828.1 PCNA-associated factor-like [Biomphalaria glabrata]XP_055864829.1 PCNA-associated factor-like [Biomphalaria glabrata]XP_055864830.1 PCNA-associated factor-like [Biomphalaria glabrata]KAI8736248.1 PCNA-associated factor-like [Biomphalaria glabrata]KAI8796074.1 PCNA-associated factor [Biomphalari
MVRTKADGCASSRKVVAAQAPRKGLGGASSSSSSEASPSGKNKYGGGNPVCPRPTPEWQKEISNFFVKPIPNSNPSSENSSSSSQTSSSSTSSGD